MGQRHLPIFTKKPTFLLSVGRAATMLEALHSLCLVFPMVLQSRQKGNSPAQGHPANECRATRQTQV